MSDHREEYKKWLQGKGNDPHPGKFSEEAAEGWKRVGVEKYDHLLAAIDAAVETKTGGRSSGQGGRVVQFPFAKWAAVAAAIAVLVLTTWLIYPSKHPGSDELYVTYFQSRTHPDAMVRGGESELAVAEKSAVEAYVAKDFPNAIKHYEILVKLSPKEPKHVLFLAISYMNQGQTAKAISLLDGFAVSNNPYEADMRWYLALAHLKQGSLNTSKGLLESLAAGSSFYAESARELLSAMKSI